MESLHVIKRGLFLATKKGLDVIETGCTKGMTLIKSRKEIPAQIVPIITHIEDQLKTYSPFTIIIFTLVVIIVFRTICVVLSKMKNTWKNRLSFKDMLTTLYFMTPGARKKLEEAKKKAREEFKKMFKVSKFKKIEFRDNKQNETTILPNTF